MLLRIVFLISVYYGQKVVVDSAVCNSSAVEAVLTQYSRDLPPSPAPATVRLALQVTHAALQDRDGTLNVHADLTMRWTDNRLWWNASEWGCDSAGVAAERLWLPDVEALNAQTAWVPAGPQIGARVSSSGEVVWSSRLILSARLPLDLTHWPNDLQTAKIRFASRAHAIDEIDLAIEHDKLRTLVYESGAWEMVSVTYDVELTQEAGWATQRRVAVWAVSVRRRAAAHAAVCGAVLGAVTLLLLAAAALPPAQRPPLAATAAFISCFWLTAWVGRLGSSGEVPRRVRAVCWGAALSCVAAVCGAAVSRLPRLTAPPPPALRAALSKLAPFCALTPLQVDSSTSGGGGSGSGSAAWGAAAVLLDRALLTLIFIALLAVLATAV